MKGIACTQTVDFIWGAVYDGDLIYASDIIQGLYVLDLVGD